MPDLRPPTLALTLGLVAGAALAHTGVQNAAVKARMTLMVDIKDATAVLGGMAQGKRSFDAALAEESRQALEAQAAKIPALFEARETDPKSEARPEIWSDWEEFVAASEAMQQAAATLDTATLETLRAGIGRLGKSCSGCHEAYRVEN